MSLTPNFQDPTDPRRNAAEAEASGAADIIQIDTALRSMRDSGFDLTAAAGEPLDNSIEAKATRIQVHTTYDTKKESIQEIAFADNGWGVHPHVLANVLSVGFSTRYGLRGGLGRFGMGLKLAGLSLGERIDIYTKRAGDPAIRHAYVDLQEVTAGTQTHIVSHEVDGWPDRYSEAMRKRGGTELESGTLVLFGKIDRLTSGGRYGTSLEEKLSELETFISRAYRKFLAKGTVIELNGIPLTLLDPLFRMDNPKVLEQYAPDDPRGTEIDSTVFEIDGHKVKVTVTLVPEIFRWESGQGGKLDRNGRDISEYQIAGRAGKISMVRNGREINYAIVPKLLPSGINKVDRYIGIEVEFPAELDEYFQVRNVKHGAVPVDELRRQLREWLVKPLRTARRKIRRHWNEVETKKRATGPEHQGVMDAVARADEHSPAGLAGAQVTPEEEERRINAVFEDYGVQGDQEAVKEIREQISSRLFSLLDLSWPGKELFEIDHLNGKVIVRMNRRHLFSREIYAPLKNIAESGADNLDPEEAVRLARMTVDAIDVLFAGYAKAENMHKNPDEFSDLRSYWGQFTQSYLQELLRDGK